MITLPSLLNNEDKSSPFGNCIRNQFRHLKKWAKRTSTDCFRLYDREIKQYPLAIDLYAGRFCIHYFSPGLYQKDPPESLIQETETLLNKIFDVNPELIFWRTRTKRKKTRQYEKTSTTKNFFTTHEYGTPFLINLEDYLDTGLFIDHRETRRLVAASSEGKRVLNLFAYTCSFSIQAAQAGAAFTKSVDMSNTYTEWGKNNFLLNSFSLKNHPIVRADCFKFLQEEVFLGEKYDRIILDPPTISRSKKMDRLLDLQADYIWLIEQALKLLSQDGMIFFSTNSRKFVFDTEYFKTCSIVEISHKTVPIDFRDPKIHRCWKITQEK